MKFSLLLLLVLPLQLLLPTSASAQSPSKILAAANKALGGEKALRSVTSWQMNGTIKRLADGADGKYASYSAGGKMYGEAYDLGGFEISSGYNGKSGWMRDSKDGLRTITGKSANDFQAEALYRNTRWLNTKAEKTKLASGGVTTLYDKQYDLVLLTTAKRVRIQLYFDRTTKLLFREVIERGFETKAYDYYDYRNVNGVQIPHWIKWRINGDTTEIAIEEVKINQPVANDLFDFPQVSNEPLPDIKSLLDEIRVNADKVNDILENYSYTELRIDRERDAAGNLVEKTSEKRLLTFYKGYRINRLIEKNGKPLSPSDQENEDKDAQKQVAEIEKKAAAKEKREVASGAVGQPKGEGQRITIADALKGSLLTNPRRERFKGRDVIVFDYEPNPTFKPQTRNEKLFALCTGAVWVDSATKQVVRLEAVLSKSAGNFLAKAKSGASFTIDNELINNEIWLPSQADINLQIKILFAGININNLIKYGDYRRFETEVKDAKVGDDK